ncbi:ssDNA endodeoxyribonuclease [Borealophlyctis nickersoniae]|nr:ssDNA endodeoxyribonuclease [Borealophlyctis nickersoniae]
MAGDVQMDYPKDTDVLESFQSFQTATHSYKFSLIQPCLRSLAVSSKTSIRVNEAGFLSLQFMIPLNEKDITFIEYTISPLAAEDGADDDDDI